MRSARFHTAVFAALVVLFSVHAFAQDLSVSTLAGLPQVSGTNDGTGSVARFFNPRGIAVDGSGVLWVADTGNHSIRQVTAGGMVTTFAGTSGALGTRDGTGTGARFNRPQGIAVDGSGNLYVADTDNHTIRKITSGGVVTTLAGFPGLQGDDDGTGSAARFRAPTGIAVDGSGNLYVADTENHIIRKVTAAGVVSTHAGIPGLAGSNDGTLTTARFNRPRKLAFDGSGNLYVTDGGQTIRKIDTGGNVTTLAGLASPGVTFPVTDNTGSAARFGLVTGITVATDGNLYVTDTGGPGGVIRRVTPTGTVTTVAGNPTAGGTTDGNGSTARLRFSDAIAAHPTSPLLFVTDTNNHTIRTAAPAIPDQATIDSPTGKINVTRQLDTSPQTATSWQWTVLIRPPGSVATFSNSTIRNPMITPDRTGLWRFQLSATSPSGLSVSMVDLFVDAVRYDVDRDGKADLIIFRKFEGGWFIQLSAGGTRTFTNIGTGANDKGIAFDTDGDAETDIVVFSQGVWTFRTSTNGNIPQVGLGSGNAAFRAAPGDFNADRSWDFSRYERFGVWQIRFAPSGSPIQNRNFGIDSDIPVPGDYDGDHFADLAVYRPSEGGWYIQRSDGGGNLIHLGFGGVAGDLPVPADYDGDGKTDIAIFRPAEGGWHIMKSSGGFTSFTGWGFNPGDIPVPADYDGDGKADYAIFRPIEGGWHIVNSGGGFTSITGWGAGPNDQPANRPPYL